MKKALVGMMLLAMACGLRAQEESVAPGRTNAAVGFNETSGAQVRLVATNAEASEVGSGVPGSSAAEPGTEAPAAEPAAMPRYIFGERDDYRWQLGVGFAYMRFQSSVIDSNMIGLNTTLTYYTNSWFGVEAESITTFSPGTIGPYHVKFFGGAGGFRIGGRRAKWEPWAHALVGGTHLQPQTAAGGRNALMAQAGAGVDYRVHSRLSLRLEGDWIYSNYFSQTQNSIQAVVGVVFHF
jgi:opacity protein-like surface antigen